MRRLVLTVCALLVSGAVINVAVAWGLSVLQTDRIFDAILLSELHQQRQQHISTVHPKVEPPWPQRSFRVVGSDLIILQDQVLPAVHHIHRVGWPVWSLQGAQRRLMIMPQGFRDGDRRLVSFVATWVITEENAIAIKRQLRLCYNADRWGYQTVDAVLPYGHIWPGFEINTVFYAAILWLMFAAPFATRRAIRRRRNRCIRCGYDLRGMNHERCPECGSAVPQRI